MPFANLEEDRFLSITLVSPNFDSMQFWRHVALKSRVAIATLPVIGLLKKPGSALAIA